MFGKNLVFCAVYLFEECFQHMLVVNVLLYGCNIKEKFIPLRSRNDKHKILQCHICTIKARKNSVMLEKLFNICTYQLSLNI